MGRWQHISRVIHRLPARGSAADPDAPSFDSLKEGRRILRALKRAEGGAYTPAEACTLLGITRAELKAKVMAKELFS